jgi:hypothetical protein
VDLAGAAGWLAAPWAITFRHAATDAALGPWMLALLPLLSLARPLPPGGRALGAFAGAWALGWLAAARDPRFLLPVWPVAAVLAARPLGALPGRAGMMVRVFCFAAMFVSPPFSAARAAGTFNPGPVLWGAITRERYAEVIIPPAHRFVALAREADRMPAPGRVLIVGDVKAARYRPRALCQSMADTPHLEAWARGSATADRLRVKVRQAGVTAVHYDAAAVLYFRDQFGWYRLTGRERAVLTEFWIRHLVPLRWFAAPPVAMLYGVSRRPIASGGPPLPGWPE